MAKKKQTGYRPKPQTPENTYVSQIPTYEPYMGVDLLPHPQHLARHRDPSTPAWMAVPNVFSSWQNPAINTLRPLPQPEHERRKAAEAGTSSGAEALKSVPGASGPDTRANTARGQEKQSDSTLKGQTGAVAGRSDTTHSGLDATATRLNTTDGIGPKTSHVPKNGRDFTTLNKGDAPGKATKTSAKSKGKHTFVLPSLDAVADTVGKNYIERVVNGPGSFSITPLLILDLNQTLIAKMRDIGMKGDILPTIRTRPYLATFLEYINIVCDGEPFFMTSVFSSTTAKNVLNVLRELRLINPRVNYELELPYRIEDAKLEVSRRRKASARQEKRAERRKMGMAVGRDAMQKRATAQETAPETGTPLQPTTARKQLDPAVINSDLSSMIGTVQITSEGDVASETFGSETTDYEPAPLSPGSIEDEATPKPVPPFDPNNPLSWIFPGTGRYMCRRDGADLLSVVLTRESFQLSQRDSNRDVLLYKDLEMVIAARSNLRSRKIHRDPIQYVTELRRSILLDDEAYKAAKQPYNHLPIVSFAKGEADPLTDNALLESIAILEILRLQPNIPAFIRLGGLAYIHGCFEGRLADIGLEVCRFYGVKIYQRWTPQWRNAIPVVLNDTPPIGEQLTAQVLDFARVQKEQGGA